MNHCKTIDQIHMEIVLPILFAPSYPKFKIPKVELEIVIFFLHRRGIILYMELNIIER